MEGWEGTAKTAVLPGEKGLLPVLDPRDPLVLKGLPISGGAERKLVSPPPLSQGGSSCTLPNVGDSQIYDPREVAANYEHHPGRDSVLQR